MNNIRSASNRRAKLKRKELGKCADCPEMAVQGKTRCPNCAAISSRRSAKAVTERRKKDGLCHFCGKESPSLRCESCAISHSLHRKERRKFFKEKGLCAECGKEKLCHCVCCVDCYMASASKQNLGTTKHRHELKERFFAEGSKCFYTGKELILGVNASLDHMNPVSRFGESANVPENLVWCDRAVNEAKKSMTKEEFIGLCKLIAGRF